MQLFYLSSLLLPRIFIFYFQVFVIWVSFVVRDFEQGFVIAWVHFVCKRVCVCIKYIYLQSALSVCVHVFLCVSLTNSRPSNS